MLISLVDSVKAKLYTNVRHVACVMTNK